MRSMTRHVTQLWHADPQSMAPEDLAIKADTMLCYTYNVSLSQLISVDCNCGQLRTISCRLCFGDVTVAKVSTHSFDRSQFWIAVSRSEEHTYELQSLMRISYAVF